MTKLEEKLWKLEVSLKDILSQLKALKTENERLTSENTGLQAAIDEQKNRIKDLEETNKRVKLAETMSQPHGDRSELKRQLEQYVNEIDRCIALLNE
jgi:predicted nuclease with TOPRIM domain